MLVRPVRTQFENVLRGQHRIHFDSEGPIPDVCCLHHSPQVSVALDMPENDLRAVENVAALHDVKILIEPLHFALAPLEQHSLLLRPE